MTLQEKFEMLAKDKFLGIPVKDFEAGGREQLGYLQRAGLRSGSKLVDIGCGVLRAGYWIVGFLDPDSYGGIEPHRERLQIGIHIILDPGTLERKRPRFDSNSNFDTSVFSDKFDFFLAYSIWTHASKPQIQATDRGRFLTTYLPAGRQISHHNFGAAATGKDSVRDENVQKRCPCLHVCHSRGDIESKGESQ
jgi:hypothetical protein